MNVLKDYATLQRSTVGSVVRLAIPNAMFAEPAIHDQDMTGKPQPNAAA